VERREAGIAFAFYYFLCSSFRKHFGYEIEEKKLLMDFKTTNQTQKLVFLLLFVTHLTMKM